MVTDNEFSHIVKIDRIGSGESSVKLIADERSRAGLQARFDLVALDSLEAELALSCTTDGVLAHGRLWATLAQHCVATGEPVSAKLDEPVKIRFIREPAFAPGAEIELQADDCDTMFYDGQAVDLGEAMAQSLGLALDPYPRITDAEKRLKAAGVKTEDEVKPLGALAGLNDLLTKNNDRAFGD